MKRILLPIAAAAALAAGAGAAPAPGIYVTAEHTALRITRVGDPDWEDLAQPTEKQDAVFVDRQRPFQTIIGIGGALTDASAETFDKLPADRQRELLRAYFDPESGIGYTLARTSIASCDFSSDVYDYVPKGDADLKNFSIAHDLRHRVPFIRAAIAAARGRLTIFASPWSPPGWMKDNGDKLHGGSLLPRYYQSWANYYCSFIEAYAKEDIPIWGLTVQNEPMAVQTWESCVYTAEQERDFVKNYLGPTLAARGLGGKRLIVWDHNR
ncbi:MAG TPA: glycosyl hydrolase, partial [Opitutaceae bacterium]